MEVQRARAEDRKRKVRLLEAGAGVQEANDNAWGCGHSMQGESHGVQLGLNLWNIC